MDEKAAKNRILEEMLKYVPDMPINAGIAFDIDKATILLIKAKSLTEIQQKAIMDLSANLIGYMFYKHEMFLDPELFADFSEFKTEDRKDLRQFALSYLEIGGIIEVKKGRIRLLSEKELYGFVGLMCATIFSEKLLLNQTTDSEKFPRHLRVEPLALGLRLIEVNEGKEKKIHKLQAGGHIRLFFDECWENDGIVLPFDHFYKKLNLTGHQKFKPTEYLRAMKFDKEDRWLHYAYVNEAEKYVYFQKHYSPNPLTKSVLK